MVDLTRDPKFSNGDGTLSPDGQRIMEELSGELDGLRSRVADLERQVRELLAREAGG